MPTVNLAPTFGVGWQALNNSGAVLTGGKLYTYAAGTTTPETTYTTSAGNIAHANPIVLNAAGRVGSGGEIWLTSTLIYKFVLTDSNDVTIATYDNVTGINDIDASQVSYTPPFTGSVTTNVEDKLAQTVSVIDFGAVGDGVTDDTAAIQTAVDAALGSASGTLWLPEGNYAVTSINIYPTGGKSLVMVGDGPLNSKFVKYGAGTDPLLNISGTAGGGGGNGVVSKCQFKNFGVQGTAKGFIGIYADTLAHFFMEGVYVTACSIGLRSLGSLIFACRSCYFIGNDIGFQADQSPVNSGYSNLIKFDDCVFQSNSTYHGLLNKGQQIVFQNCDFESGTTSFRVASTYEDETGYSSVTWNNCWWEGNSSNPVIVDSNNTWVTMRDCTLYGVASSVTINGSGNNVCIENCYGTEYLNMVDSTGSITISNCLFPIYSISTPNQVITNLNSNSGRISFSADKINTSEGSVSTTSGVAVNIASTGTNQVTIVTAYISGASVNETCSGIVIEGVISNVSNGSNMSLSVSGASIQVTQTTGISQTVRYVVLRIR